MFHWWHRARDGTLKRSTFRQYMWQLRAGVEGLLREGARCGHMKTERSCKRLVKEAKYLWTFVDVDGVEPANNVVERALRLAVQWRKGSFGAHSAEGSRFVERIVTAAPAVNSATATSPNTSPRPASRVFTAIPLHRYCPCPPKP